MRCHGVLRDDNTSGRLNFHIVFQAFHVDDVIQAPTCAFALFRLLEEHSNIIQRIPSYSFPPFALFQTRHYAGFEVNSEVAGCGGGYNLKPQTFVAHLCCRKKSAVTFVTTSVFVIGGY